ncbi:hypothetical protein [Sedimentitalea todarodis]|uniref:NADH:ubiquinone oxidoreductase n=1 Tax=Sedimentitalea todarodis TaxID=1631240 RepID=A0ABU3VE39_9RHOB|nr:hypothetical protein [Sedimentitalea todarodis]MDU9004446.1 hypothetical protein [Sedimentitalea todarodis]
MSGTKNSALYIAICWILGGLIGIGLAVVISDSVPAIFAALIGTAAAVAIAVFSQIYICGFNADHWGPFEGFKAAFRSDLNSTEEPTGPVRQPIEEPSTVPIRSTLHSEEQTGTQPDLPAKAQDGDVDDLKQIDGIGPKLEEKLNGIGIFRFEQIAGWSPEKATEIDQQLNFRGRIERDKWIAQAKGLAPE